MTTLVCLQRTAVSPEGNLKPFCVLLIFMGSVWSLFAMQELQRLRLVDLHYLNVNFPKYLITYAQHNIFFSRYLLHHLLTGSVLAVWSRIEKVYDEYNTGHANSSSHSGASTGQKRFAMRIARVVLSSSSSSQDSSEVIQQGASTSPTTNTAHDSDSIIHSISTTQSPTKRNSPRAANNTILTSPAAKASLVASPTTKTPINASISQTDITALSLVGIWVPATRIKEVLRALRKHQQEINQQKLTAPTVPHGPLNPTVLK